MCCCVVHRIVPWFSEDCYRHRWEGVTCTRAECRWLLTCSRVNMLNVAGLMQINHPIHYNRRVFSYCWMSSARMKCRIVGTRGSLLKRLFARTLCFSCIKSKVKSINQPNRHNIAFFLVYNSHWRHVNQFPLFIHGFSFLHDVSSSLLIPPLSLSLSLEIMWYCLFLLL